MGRTPLILVGVFLFVTASIANCRADNPVYKTLITRGVPVGGSEVVKLPAPTLADGLSAADQRRAIEAVAGESHTWEDLDAQIGRGPVRFEDFQRRGSAGASRPATRYLVCRLWLDEDSREPGLSAKAV